MRISTFLTIFAAAAVVVLVACKETEAQQVKAAVHKISADEAHKMMQELKSYTLLDVRTENEFKEKRIKGAILIPDHEVKPRAEKELTDKNQPILIYCRSGRRSAKAAEELTILGYKKVYDFGGIIDWNYEVEAD
ncbi:MAG: rhodanese-like domain-containing protein [Fibromonadaceae bacterium]|jgi:rhodanese-related sulfurtransferase|nr:rhodanese-like domain-containing protein [Fibromonadaceae bacterium]